MTFIPYLDYTTYVDLGGVVSEASFPVLERKAQRLLDYFTYNRIPKLQEIPDVVLEVLTDYINRMGLLDDQRENGDVISSYSNGVEKIDYKLKTEDETQKELYNIAIKWLPDYLVNRSVNFDVEKYLQSKSNNS